VGLCICGDPSCICGDPYCASCGNPGAAAVDEAEQSVMEMFHNAQLTPEEYELAATAGLAVVNILREMRKKTPHWTEQLATSLMERGSLRTPEEVIIDVVEKSLENMTPEQADDVIEQVQQRIKSQKKENKDA